MEDPTYPFTEFEDYSTNHTKKVIEAELNSKFGYDLYIERDADNLIRILTGNEANSIAVWMKIARISYQVLKSFEIKKEDRPFNIK